MDIVKRSRGDIGLREIAKSIEHYLQHWDSTGLLRLIATLGRADGAIVREILQRCVIGVQIINSPKDTFGLRLKKTTEVPEPTSALGLIHKLADKGLSFRSKVVAEQLKLTRTFPDDYDLDGALTRMIQRAQEAGRSKDVMTVLQTCQRTIFRIDP